jgi:hypothetical protein
MLTPIHVREGGWVLAPVSTSKRTEYVCVRFELTSSGRLEPAEVWTHMPEALEGFSLRKITGAVNGPRLRELVTYQISTTRHFTEVVRLLQWVRNARARGGSEQLRIGGIDDQETTQRKPDAFYRDVANAYAAALAAGHHNPAAKISEENDVGVARVRGWIREARKRGILPPADRPGRAG